MVVPGGRKVHAAILASILATISSFKDQTNKHHIIVKVHKQESSSAYKKIKNKNSEIQRSESMYSIAAVIINVPSPR